MKTFHSLGLLVLFLCAGTDGRADETRDQIAAVVTQFRDKGHFQGIVLVANQDATIYETAIGVADAEAALDNTLATRFRIASITKGFTAVLALQAAERGEFDLQKSLLDYLPEVENPALAAVTVDHLLRHTSGIEDFAPVPTGPEQSVRAALIEQLSTLKLKTSPGKKHKYCNVGYTIVGFILEAATGKSYGELLEERIFQPAAMSDSYLETTPAENYPPRAKGYARQQGQLVPEEVEDLSLFPAAGGIVSTGPDLWKFSQALAGDVLLSDKSKQKMQAGKGKASYGCSSVTLPTGDQVQIFQGGMPGANSALVRVSDGQYTIVVLSNVSQMPTQSMARTILMSLLD